VLVKALEADRDAFADLLLDADFLAMKSGPLSNRFDFLLLPNC
jgi:hypothetical protein